MFLVDDSLAPWQAHLEAVIEYRQLLCNHVKYRTNR
jgi:hypothetical protein